MNHVEVFGFFCIIFTAHGHLSYVLKRDAIFFQGNTEEEALKLSQEDERKRKKGRFYRSYSLLENNTYMYKNKGYDALDQDGGMTLWFVG